jgi:uncharacterized protein
VNGLSMRVSCERCGTALRDTDVAFICSYECTFCETCTRLMEHACPNCGGELLRRPRRSIAVLCHVERLRTADEPRVDDRG